MIAGIIIHIFKPHIYRPLIVVGQHLHMINGRSRRLPADREVNGRHLRAENGVVFRISANGTCGTAAGLYLRLSFRSLTRMAGVGRERTRIRGSQGYLPCQFSVMQILSEMSRMEATWSVVTASRPHPKESQPDQIQIIGGLHIVRRSVKDVNGTSTDP